MHKKSATPSKPSRKQGACLASGAIQTPHKFLSVFQEYVIPEGADVGALNGDADYFLQIARSTMELLGHAVSVEGAEKEAIVRAMPNVLFGAMYYLDMSFAAAVAADAIRCDNGQGVTP